MVWFGSRILTFFSKFLNCANVSTQHWFQASKKKTQREELDYVTLQSHSDRKCLFIYSTCFCCFVCMLVLFNVQFSISTKFQECFTILIDITKEKLRFFPDLRNFENNTYLIIDSRKCEHKQQFVCVCGFCGISM